MRKTNPFLAVLCLSVFACEAPIDLGDRGLEGSGGGTQTTKFAATGGATHQTGATFLARCGDGVLQASEACDDGNVSDGDGCAANCQEIQPGYRCVAPGIACEFVTNPNALCGNGKLEAAEPCDDGNTSPGDGCNAECQLESGWRCSSVVTIAPATVSVCASACGDGIAVGAEQCDLGTANGTGACSFDCKISATCGNGRIDPSEECDDGNRLDSDGCSRACRMEAGWECEPVMQRDGLMASECMTVCGDGVAAGAEQCDLGYENGNGPCNVDCTLFAICGDGVLQPGEQCDDGNNNGEYGGCGLNCVLGPHCGDGLVNGPEQCDDGNNNGEYGRCAPTCVLGSYCGDGIVNRPEQCDDGNAIGGDGCTASCTIES